MNAHCASLARFVFVGLALASGGCAVATEGSTEPESTAKADEALLQRNPDDPSGGPSTLFSNSKSTTSTCDVHTWVNDNFETALVMLGCNDPVATGTTYVTQQNNVTLASTTTQTSTFNAAACPAGNVVYTLCPATSTYNYYTAAGVAACYANVSPINASTFTSAMCNEAMPPGYIGVKWDPTCVGSGCTKRSNVGGL